MKPFSKWGVQTALPPPSASGCAVQVPGKMRVLKPQLLPQGVRDITPENGLKSNQCGCHSGARLLDFPDVPWPDEVTGLEEPTCPEGTLVGWATVTPSPAMLRCIRRAVEEANWEASLDVGEYNAAEFGQIYADAVADWVNEFRSQMNSTTHAPSDDQLLCTRLLNYLWVWDFVKATLGPKEGVRRYINDLSGGRIYIEDPPLFPGERPLPSSGRARICVPSSIQDHALPPVPFETFPHQFRRDRLFVT